jgi:hypothetical protein
MSSKKKEMTRDGSWCKQEIANPVVCDRGHGTCSYFPERLVKPVTSFHTRLVETCMLGANSGQHCMYSNMIYHSLCLIFPSNFARMPSRECCARLELQAWAWEEVWVVVMVSAITPSVGSREDRHSQVCV